MRLSLPTQLIFLLQTALHGVSGAYLTGIPNGGSAAGRIGSIQTVPVTVHKPRSLDFLQKTRLRSLRGAECLAPLNETESLEWDAVEVQGPNVEDRHTLAQLARMAGNAYALRGLPNWYDIDDAWNTSFPFGWEEGEGFRGHVFLSSDNNTIVLSIKGTTVQGPTSRLDKYNDNLLFSCCCARHAWVMRTVCDCFGSGWKCDGRCLSDALIQDSLFYSVGTKLIDDLIHIYPNADLWLVGHSLGGALASLLGATYGLPAIAFESPGERLAAQRLHLPIPPTEVPPPEEDSISPALRSVLHRLPILEMFLGNPRIPRAPPPPPPHAASITHVYHTADPIPFGTCNGPYSICATGGYALETKCHLGKSIILDTVNRMKWLVDVRKHVIKQVVQLLDMPEEGEDGVDWGEEGGGDDDDDDDEPDPCKGGDWCLQQRVLSTLRGWDSVVPGGWGPGRGKKDKKKKGGDGDEKKPISNRVPKPIIESDCVDCFRWEFGSYKDELKA